ncbi:hypothetical protein FRC09_020892 [Ceratobasidium sp. 395]|nr:hypothetical protein FRC09_020892 [Ceratobasidium sp. 395]
MVWIFGGGFYVGDIHSYPGTYFVQRSIEIGKPVIYVAINYRLGLYGFPPGQAAADAGALNLGLKDQRLALEWVQSNIEYFGGGRNKVTIFGNSAGAISSSYQSLYRSGNIKGAFRGMILGSGAPSTLYVRQPNDPVREQASQFIVNATGCATASNQFECIRAAPASVLSQANKDVVKVTFINHLKTLVYMPKTTPLKVDPYYSSVGRVPATTGPTTAPGDDFLPDRPAKLIHSGRFAKVPFISGNQLDEGTVFVDGANADSDQDLINAAATVDISNKAMGELLQYYPTPLEYGSPYNTGNQTFGQGTQYKRFASIYGDYAFQAARRDHLNTARKFGVKVWAYIMSEKPLDFVPLYGIRHGENVPFFMQSYSVSNVTATPAQVDLQRAIGDYWIAFAYNLDPNPPAELNYPTWPAYGLNKTALQLLASNITLVQDTNRTDATDFIIKLYG